MLLQVTTYYTRAKCIAIIKTRFDRLYIETITLYGAADCLKIDKKNTKNNFKDSVLYNNITK